MPSLQVIPGGQTLSQTIFIGTHEPSSHCSPSKQEEHSSGIQAPLMHFPLQYCEQGGFSRLHFPHIHKGFSFGQSSWAWQTIAWQTSFKQNSPLLHFAEHGFLVTQIL
jgi:hypothetical protein